MREPSEDMDMSPADLDIKLETSLAVVSPPAVKTEPVEAPIPERYMKMWAEEKKPVVKAEPIQEAIPGLAQIMAEVRAKVRAKEENAPTHPPRPVSDMFNLDDLLPPKPAPRNPFISGGFVTDFVGAALLPVKATPLNEPASDQNDAVLGRASDSDLHLSPSLPPPDTLPFGKPQTGSHLRRARKWAKQRAEAQVAANNNPLPPLGDANVERGGGHDDSSSSTRTPEMVAIAPPTPSSSVPQRAPRQLAQNAIASSSKACLPPPTPPTALGPRTSTSILPRQVVALSGRAKEKAPVSSNVAFSTLQIDTSSNATPPPELKALAYIPAGPSSNPLSIRASSSALPPPLPRPSTSTPFHPKSKKPVVVGRGWPFTRSAIGAADISTPGPIGKPTPGSASTLTSVSDPPAANIASVDLRNILGYSSPSPPVPAANGPASKWKSIDRGMSGSRDSPIDMVISDPPSPVDEARLNPFAVDINAPISSSLLDRIADTPSLLDRISSGPHQAKEPNADSFSLLCRISQLSGKANAPVQQRPQSPAVPRVAHSQKPSDTLFQANSAKSVSSKNGQQRVLHSHNRSAPLPSVEAPTTRQTTTSFRTHQLPLCAPAGCEARTTYVARPLDCTGDRACAV
ncbi:hypothetical protein C8R43DRAFT_149382 [Mycena crocata]|nr:hypothetical protein C8R43DRAFT_149382 [Mycena crocata]